MNWTNFHTHSFHCHGEDGLEEYVRKAIDKKMFAIGFSGHAPVPFVSEWNMKQARLDEYLKEISALQNKYRNDIKIYSGLEVDFIPYVIGPNNFHKQHLDIIIGSVHYVGQFENGENCVIDYTKEEFEKGLETIFNNDIKKLVGTYYGNVVSMIKNDPPDVIGHLDKIKKFNHHNRYFSEKDNWYQNIVTEVLKVISKTSCIVEINTRGYYEGTTGEFYPSRWILEKCLKYNIPITISSDAHKADDIDNSFEKAASLLLKIGYKHVHIFNEGKWCDVGLRENGFGI
ncbi:histidinol-phosphatase HisJ [candidate division KSB1 bacterium]|nr:histidinol-phosphatase HisJ [candidate division KSB1 bacterium]